MSIKKLIISSILTISSLFLLQGCQSTEQGNRVVFKADDVRNYYKTIDVEIVNITKGYAKNYCQALVEVKSEEYNLSETFNLTGSLMHNDKYIQEIINGQLEVGDVIQAEMRSRVVNGEVKSRHLNQLK